MTAVEKLQEIDGKIATLKAERIEALYAIWREAYMDGRATFGEMPVWVVKRLHKTESADVLYPEAR